MDRQLSSLPTPAVNMLPIIAGLLPQTLCSLNRACAQSLRFKLLPVSSLSVPILRGAQSAYIHRQTWILSLIIRTHACGEPSAPLLLCSCPSTMLSRCTSITLEPVPESLML